MKKDYILIVFVVLILSLFVTIYKNSDLEKKREQLSSDIIALESGAKEIERLNSWSKSSSSEVERKLSSFIEKSDNRDKNRVIETKELKERDFNSFIQNLLSSSVEIVSIDTMRVNENSIKATIEIKK